MGKACGPDKITGKELQMLGDVFIDNLLNIAKKSFDDWMFPSQWKTAQIHCIHKKGSTQDCGSYHPTSLLRACLCKILISSFAHKMDFAHNFSVDFF